ncbi:MAG TPA: MFS transporter [Microbacterium sp.]|nr:MFS transporter [Microbacterium sp.]
MGHTITNPIDASASGRLRLAPLLLLAAAVWATVTVELVPAGLLPDVADEFGIRVSTAGVMVSAWAVTIAVASLPLARLFRRTDRRMLLVGALAVMALANIALALAPSFEIIAVCRIIAAAAHGAFWSTVMVYAAAISPPAHTGRAVTITGAGAAVAVFLGVPLGTFIGQAAGWRATFWMLAALLGACALIIRLTLPAVAGSRADQGRQRGSDATVVPVILIVSVQLFVAFAHFSLYTYVSPFLTDRVGIAEQAVGVLLLVSGIGGLVGLVAVSFTADRFPRASMIVALVLLFIALLALASASGSLPAAVASFVVWGIAIGALPPLLLARTLSLASDRLRTVASAMAVVAFNAGIAIGAWSGALIVDGPGLTVLPAAAASAAAVALAICLLSLRLDRKDPR